ncbi:hypothetical protein CY34DRAFT_808616 [Suillus luteus UH-Slu-Lm8-n1]|uniref:Uncharacterized protein n=1 Tax=Suillus luteus UH-Slu-Lm8-n1 TaxID=930992 RepID=A0A0D0ABK1_9AGAM|nr:hypothetical protein CY34DRAFT_808616 [Suillus luteus UH-Slu-Lm8-n1]
MQNAAQRVSWTQAKTTRPKEAVLEGWATRRSEHRAKPQVRCWDQEHPMKDELKNTWGMWYRCTMIWDAVGGIVMKGGIIYHRWQITLGWQSLDFLGGQMLKHHPIV